MWDENVDFFCQNLEADLRTKTVVSRENMPDSR